MLKKDILISARIKLDISSGDLFKAIDDEYSSGEAIIKSNRGGWHSSYKLHESGSDIIKSVSKDILNISNFLLNKKTKSPNHSMSQFWINLNNKGDWNSPHNHLNLRNHDHNPIWSGVYYVSVNGFNKQESLDVGGDLILFFTDDNGVVGHHVHKPEDNQILLFKSETLHMVTPYNDDATRISIAFNLYFIDEKQE